MVALLGPVDAVAQWHGAVGARRRRCHPQPRQTVDTGRRETVCEVATGSRKAIRAVGLDPVEPVATLDRAVLDQRGEDPDPEPARHVVVTAARASQRVRARAFLERADLPRGSKTR